MITQLMAIGDGDGDRLSLDGFFVLLMAVFCCLL
jgi:hypothetical protein